MQKGLSAGVISDPATFISFIGNVARHLTVDNDLSDEEIKRTAHSLRLTGKDIDCCRRPSPVLPQRATDRALTLWTRPRWPSCPVP